MKLTSFFALCFFLFIGCLCDTNEELTERIKNLEVRLSSLEKAKEPGRVIFEAWQNNGLFGTNEDVTYDDIIIDTANAMDKSSGTYTIPISGVYQFSFSTLKSESRYILVHFYVNGDQKFVAAYWENIEIYSGRSWKMSLKQGDEVKLRVTNGIIFAVSEPLVPISFSGHLLHEFQ